MLDAVGSVAVLWQCCGSAVAVLWQYCGSTVARWAPVWGWRRILVAAQPSPSTNAPPGAGAACDDLTGGPCLWARRGVENPPADCHKDCYVTFKTVSALAARCLVPGAWCQSYAGHSAGVGLGTVRHSAG